MQPGETERSSPTPTVERVQNGWHALSRELNLAVWGATADEARERFDEAARKVAEIRARPDVGTPSPNPG